MYNKKFDKSRNINVGMLVLCRLDTNYQAVRANKLVQMQNHFQDGNNLLHIFPKYHIFKQNSTKMNKNEEKYMYRYKTYNKLTTQ